MRYRCLVAIAVLIGFWGWPQVATAQKHNLEIPTIQVRGDASHSVSPDFAEWFIQVRAQDMDSAKAKALNDERLAMLEKAIDRLGVESEDVEVGVVVVQPVQKLDRQTSQMEFMGYMVARNILVKQRDLDQFDDFLQALNGDGVVINFRYRSTQETQAYDQAVLDAVDQAKRTADAVAERLGQTVGRPLKITSENRAPEFPPLWPNIGNNPWRYMQPVQVSSAVTSFSLQLANPSDIVIRTNVSVAFELE